MKLNRFNYLMTQGVKNIFTHGFMSFASITIIIACLLIMGLACVLSYEPARACSSWAAFRC